MFNDLIKNLILNATKSCGRTNSEDILNFVEEQMTIPEYKKAKAFLDWSFKTGKTFGWNNFDDRVKEFETFKQRSN